MKQKQASNKAYRLFTLDSRPALNGECKTPHDWIDYFNIREDAKGSRMISAPDLYRAASAPKQILEGLITDFRESLIVTSTKLQYNPDNLSGKVIHNFGSIVLKPIEIKLNVVPVLDRISLSEALISQETLIYLNALFNTRDKADKIMETLEHLSKINSDNIIVMTQDQSWRRYRSEPRSVLFSIGRFAGKDRFLIDGLNGEVYVYGRSRGVSLKSNKANSN